MPYFLFDRKHGEFFAEKIIAIKDGGTQHMHVANKI